MWHKCQLAFSDCWGEKHFKPHTQNRILVPLRGEKQFKPQTQNRILVPLRGEKHFKPHPQNRILVPLRGEKHFKPHPQNRILVPLRGEKLSTHAQETRSWYCLEVLFKISIEHPNPFYMGVSPHPSPMETHWFHRSIYTGCIKMNYWNSSSGCIICLPVFIWFRYVLIWNPIHLNGHQPKGDDSKKQSFPCETRSTESKKGEKWWNWHMTHWMWTVPFWWQKQKSSSVIFDLHCMLHGIPIMWNQLSPIQISKILRALFVNQWSFSWLHWKFVV